MEDLRTQARYKLLDKLNTLDSIARKIGVSSKTLSKIKKDDRKAFVSQSKLKQVIRLLDTI